MADDKNIRFRAVIDAADFDRGLTDIQRKLKSMQGEMNRAQNAMRTLGSDPVMGKYAQSAFGGVSAQGQTELRRQEQDLKRKADEEIRQLEGKKKKILELEQLESKRSKNQENQLNILQKQTIELEKQHKITVGDMSNVVGTRRAAGLVDQYGKPIGTDSTPTGGGIKELIKNVGVASLISGIANAIVQISGDVITRDRKITQASGQAAGVLAQDMRAQFSGQGSRAMFFARERAQAMDMAAREAQSQSTLGRVKAWGGTALQIGGAAAVATGVGALGGLAAMGVGTAMKGGIIGDETSRAAMMDPQKYRSMMTAQGMGNYQTNLSSLKIQGGARTLGQEYFQSQAGSIADLETSLGTNTRGLMGYKAPRKKLRGQSPRPDANDFTSPKDGIVNQAAYQKAMKEWQADETDRAKEELGVEQQNRRAAQRDVQGLLPTQMKLGEEYGGNAFTKGQITSQMSAIRGAGGGTDAMGGSSGFAAAMKRQLGVTTAGTAVGKLSGAGMESGQTDETTRRFIASAIQLGVNQSKLHTMPQEISRLVAMQAQIATASGVFSAGAAQTALAGTTGLDAASIAAGSGFQQDFQKKGKEGGGLGGQLGMGHLMGKGGDKIRKNRGKGLGSTEMNYLNQISADELGENDLLGIADYLDLKGSDQEKKDLVRDLLGGKDLAKQTLTAEEEAKVGEFGAFLKANPEIKNIDDIYNSSMTAGKKKKFGGMAKEVTAMGVSSFGGEVSGKTTKGRSARAFGLANKSSGVELLGTSKQAGGVDVEAKRPGTSEAKDEVGSQATGELTRIEAVAANLDDLGKAARAHTKHAEVFNAQFEIFIKAIQNANEAGSLDKLTKQFEKMSDAMADAGYNTVLRSKVTK